MPTSVVVGAFQFVGFHLAKYLLDQGEEVIGIDWEDVMLWKKKWKLDVIAISSIFR